MLWRKTLCRGAWGMQSDMQCTGYDSLCALAALFYNKAAGIDSYKAIELAQKEVQESPYSRGFHHAWDGDKASETDADYLLGYEDAKKIVKKYKWRTSKSDDCYAR